MKIMATGILGLLFILGTASAWNVTLDANYTEIHMEETACIPFSAEVTEADRATSYVNVTCTPTHVAVVDGGLYIEPTDVTNNIWNSCLNVTGNFLGSANIIMTITTTEGTKTSGNLPITVIRPERVIDTVFVYYVAILVSIIYINFGCAMDWDICKRTLKRPVGPAIGFGCQFIFMPLASYALGRLLFPNDAYMQLGMFFTGVSPSGGASNIWTVLLGGNLNLSVTMTTISTLAAFGMMPLWIFTLGGTIFERANIVVPYARIGTFAVSLVIPLGIGYLIQKKLPRVSRLLVRILKPFSSLLIIGIIVFAIVTNLYLFELFSWQIVISGMGLPWLGYGCGWIVAYLLKQPFPDVTAISIETGVQNTGISIFLLRFSLPQPAADLTTIAPVAVAIMTPIPLTILFIIKSIRDCRKKKIAASAEKLQGSSDPVPTIVEARMSVTAREEP